MYQQIRNHQYNKKIKHHNRIITINPHENLQIALTMLQPRTKRDLIARNRAPMSVENPAFRMELFHDTSIHPPFPNIINNNRNNNNNNNNNDITTPKTIDNDITTPKTVITADIHNTDNINNTDNNNHLNNNNNESFGMTGNSNADNNHGDSNSLPPNWRYNEEHNINTDNINNLQCNTNNNNNKRNKTNSYDTICSESWSHEEWDNDSNYYKDNAHYIDSNRGSHNSMINDNSLQDQQNNNDLSKNWSNNTCEPLDNSNNSQKNKNNSYDTIYSESWSHEEWDDDDSDHYRDNAQYTDSNRGSNNNLTSENNLQHQQNNSNLGGSCSNNTCEPLDNKNEKSEMNQNRNSNSLAKIEKHRNKNDSQYTSAVKLNTDDKTSVDSVPNTPPPTIPFQIVWVSASTQGSLDDGNVYESIENNMHLLETKLNSNPELPKRHSTLDMDLPANQSTVMNHSPSCPMFGLEPNKPDQRRRSLPLVSRVPKMEFIANLPPDSVIAILSFIETAISSIDCHQQLTLLPNPLFLTSFLSNIYMDNICYRAYCRTCRCQAARKYAFRI